MYTSKLVLVDQEIDRMFDFILIAKTLELDKLLKDISLLVKEGIHLENVVSIYEIAIRYDQTELKESCEHLIDKNAEYLVSQKYLTKLSSQYLEQIIGRDSFSLNESKILELFNEWHVYHNQTKNFNNELIKKIRFEFISQKELYTLTNNSKLINKELALNTIMKERIFHEKTIIRKRKLRTNILASGSSDESIKIWNIDTGECIRTLTGHTNSVYSLQLLANNKLASGSSDATIKIWNVDTGECCVAT